VLLLLLLLLPYADRCVSGEVLEQMKQRHALSTNGGLIVTLNDTVFNCRFLTAAAAAAAAAVPCRPLRVWRGA
jgi:hypothetical protein